MTMRAIVNSQSGDVFVIGADWALCEDKGKASKFARAGALSIVLGVAGAQFVSTLDSTFVKANLGRRKVDGNNVGKRGKKRSFISAAALIAKVERNAVVLHEIDKSGLTWIAAIRDGVPLPGSDKVLEKAEAYREFGEWLNLVPSATVIGTDNDAGRSVDSVFSGADAKQREASVYTKPKSPLLPLIYAVAATGMVVAAVFAFQSIKGAREAADRAKTIALAKLNESARIDAAISQYNVDVKRVVEQARRLVESNVVVSEQLKSWLAILDSQPLVRGAFRLDAVNCDAAACRVTWQVLPSGSLLWPDAAAVVASRDDASIVLSVPLAPVKSGPRVVEDRVDLISRFHELGAVGSLSFSVAPSPIPIVIPTPPKPNVPPEMVAKLAAVQPVTVGYRSDVTLNSPRSLLIDSVNRMGNSVDLKTFDAVGLTSPNGGALSPLIKTTGWYVRLPK